jgi:hypothetical protein
MPMKKTHRPRAARQRDKIMADTFVSAILIARGILFGGKQPLMAAWVADRKRGIFMVACNRRMHRNCFAILTQFRFHAIFIIL